MNAGMKPLSEKLRLIVLAGGESAERDVSLESGAAVAVALRSRGHEVLEIDPQETDLDAVRWKDYQAVFISLHGTFGEDGDVQEYLEYIGIPFTGSGSTASRLAFRKSAAKVSFREHGLPTPPSILLPAMETRPQIVAAGQQMGYPLVVKPDAQGSSVGVHILEDESRLVEAFQDAASFDEFILLEKAILGTEWTVGVLNAEALPVIQIVPAREFYDYQAKYEDDLTQYLFDFDAPPMLAPLLQTLGVQACRAVGTQGIARVDFRVDQQNRPWLLEVNTIPGMTSHSLIPKAAARMGIDFPDLCEFAIADCLQDSLRTQQRSLKAS